MTSHVGAATPHASQHGAVPGTDDHVPALGSGRHSSIDSAEAYAAEVVAAEALAGTTVVAEPLAAHPTSAPDVLIPSPFARDTRAYSAWFFLRSSPGLIVTIGVITALLAIASGVAAYTNNSHRQHALQQALLATEPLSNAAGELYSALSIADAAATTAFIAGGVESSDIRNRYDQAITDATGALVTASAGIAVTDLDAGSTRGLLTNIAQQLPIYIGLVDTARTNNRDGNPVGSSYLSEASTLMQSVILPDAEQLYHAISGQMGDAVSQFTDPPYRTFGLLLLTIFVLLLVQLWLARRTNHRLNPGLLLASLAVVATLVWTAAAGVISVTESRHARTHGAEPLAMLTTARINAQQARAGETLTLVRRGDEGEQEKSFMDRTNAVQAALTAYLDSNKPVAHDRVSHALLELGRWRDAHGKIAQLTATGDYLGATAEALGAGKDDASPSFDDLDSDLRDGIERLRTQLRGDIYDAERALSALSAGSLGLAIFAAAAIGVGLWPRLSEYH